MLYNTKSNLSKVYSPAILQDLVNKSIQIYNALSQNKIDENIIVDILSNTTNEERQIIRNNFKNIFHIPIQNFIKLKLKNNSLLLDIITNMFDTPYEYDAKELKKALSTNKELDENIIIEIFSTRPKKYLKIVDIAYKNFFNISLKEEIKKKFSKEYSDYLLIIMDAKRPFGQTISKNEAYEIAKEIVKIGIKEYSNNADLFKKIFVEKSRIDLILISRAYYELEKKSLYETILEENSRQQLINYNNEKENVQNKKMKFIKELFLAIITPPQFFAQKCSLALKGLKTDVNTLIRILISRAEIDINMIRDYYYKETKSHIKKDIQNKVKLKKINNATSIIINLFK